MSNLSLRRSCAVSAAAVALASPLAITAVTAASAAASLPAASTATFGHPLQVSGPRHAGPGTISNWGGYVAHGSPGTFTSATAAWRIAKVDCSRNALFAPWVGIDGDGNNTVEQTGAATRCSGGVASYAAWYEMYPQPPVYYDDPISVGDKFKASVTVSGIDFTLKISDLTKGWTEQVTKSSATAQKSTAEAVIEGPGGYPDFQVQKFAKVRFNGQGLATWNPVEYDTRSGSTTIYTATPIKHQTKFTMVPLT